MGSLNLDELGVDIAGEIDFEGPCWRGGRRDELLGRHDGRFPDEPARHHVADVFSEPFQETKHELRGQSGLDIAPSPGLVVDGWEFLILGGGQASRGDQGELGVEALVVKGIQSVAVPFAGIVGAAPKMHIES